MQTTKVLLPFIVIRLAEGEMNITAACLRNNAISLNS
jgi:hypothetical protein|tara:strand:+ start:2348 stop:2458 length:111 start_codon:yes stop_codon:yes gene_type:complete